MNVKDLRNSNYENQSTQLTFDQVETYTRVAVTRTNVQKLAERATRAYSASKFKTNASFKNFTRREKARIWPHETTYVKLSGNIRDPRANDRTDRVGQEISIDRSIDRNGQLEFEEEITYDLRLRSEHEATCAGDGQTSNVQTPTNRQMTKRVRQHFNLFQFYSSE
ncbi:hypothetical protein RUM44_005734 [Polyplax serrata]|uniref:Uncharacterized protein n=1 Tax=Polyplax serrata TaxID=468196 RepID=A0ABR1AWD5_POLSC